jgi:hypothetical protein
MIGIGVWVHYVSIEQEWCHTIDVALQLIEDFNEKPPMFM